MPYTLEQLSDRQDLVDLVHVYCRAVDDNRPDDIAALFAEDCVLDYGGSYTNLVGRALARRFFAGGTDRLYQRTAHHLSNIEISFSGTEANGRRRAAGTSYVWAWHEFNQDQFDEPTPNAWIYGRYLDRFVNQDGQWLIAARTFRAMGHHQWQSPVAWIDREPRQSPVRTP
jgi:SnoaL-like domain